MFTYRDSLTGFKSVTLYLTNTSLFMEGMKKLYVVAIVTGIIAGFLLDVMSAVIEGTGVYKIAIILGLVSYGTILCGTIYCYDQIRRMPEPLKFW